ncbi:hypothetical protein AJ80_06070 [Polytolypa hystricis UAMH7299]|uniref:Respiratory supercomplex factor 1, mitochondrial n=1 Tax=Polytolypa hystricis (strain UAMH7299) TaxID=1447883 RepID=A0A2B7XXX2_POLH7|nr:hypothetical protein AJ80_06070 [Polytolypa hystricis UAMH7299]
MPDRSLPSSFDQEFFEEKPFQKIKRKLMQEPLIPLGCAATSYALWRAYKSMKAGNSTEMNRMFRARIYAQGFTIVAMVAGGIYFKEERKQRKELQGALEEKKGQEKRDAWLRELETRDKEDRDWKERHAAIEEAAKEAENKANGAQDAVAQLMEEVEKKKDETADTVQEVVEEGEGKSGGVLNAVQGLWGKK